LWGGAPPGPLLLPPPGVFFPPPPPPPLQNTLRRPCFYPGMLLTSTAGGQTADMQFESYGNTSQRLWAPDHTAVTMISGNDPRSCSDDMITRRYTLYFTSGWLTKLGNFTVFGAAESTPPKGFCYIKVRHNLTALLHCVIIEVYC